MNEFDPIHFGNLHLPDGEKLEVTTENTILYNHPGRLSLFDHLFIQMGEKKGLFIWAQIPPDNPNYVALAPAAVENGCEVRVNLREVAEGDMEMFEEYSLSDIDEIPDWLAT
jgi:hypothetical protein